MSAPNTQRPAPRTQGRHRVVMGEHGRWDIEYADDGVRCIVDRGWFREDLAQAQAEYLDRHPYPDEWIATCAAGALTHSTDAASPPRHDPPPGKGLAR
jgi:hypothetical protein